MLRTAFLLMSLTMLGGGAYAAQSALDIQEEAYIQPATSDGLLVVVGSPEMLLDH